MGNIFSISLSCDAIVTRCWGKTSYTRNLEENLDALSTEVEKLKALRTDVMRRVFIEEGKHLQRLDQVEAWLSRAEDKTTVAEQLIRDGPQHVKKLCFGGCCSKNYKSSYKFGKKIARSLQNISALLMEGAFEKVAEMVPIPAEDEIPSEPTVGLESTFDETWSCLKQDNTGIMGLYGMGGVGKTTLLTQINNQLIHETTNQFDHVIWIVVSKNHTIEKIQHSVGKKLGIANESWFNKGEDEKKLNIFGVLRKKKFVLLLDDIWERVDLMKVGVPLPSKENGCKVIFTTRSEEVCGQMKAQKKIRVECLEWHKAWQLFRENVGEETLNVHIEVPKIAKLVVKECGGLPLALITIGRAMSCKRTLEEWHHAIVLLKNSASLVSGMGDEVFPLLKFSYDNLRDNQTKSCLLYCSLFPEDFHIHKTELVDHWNCEGLLEEDDVCRTRPRLYGYEIIGTLVRACLLEEIDDKRVKMHDVVRDMALWIAGESGKMEDKYLVQTNAELIEAPEVRKWRDCGRISLIENRIENLLDPPKCPNLVTLLLQVNLLKTISNDFFQFMPRITVLNLSANQSLDELPLTISKLVSLQYLNLSSTGIKQLPIELKSLVKLKCLIMEYTNRLRIIPQCLISSFPKLQVLKIYGRGLGSGRGNNTNDGEELLLEEVHCLNHLNSLSMDVKCVGTLQKIVGFYKFQSYIEALCLLNLVGSKSLDISFLERMNRLDKLRIEDCQSLEVIRADGPVTQPALDVQISVMNRTKWFNNLQRLRIHNCPRLRDLSWLVLVPNLKRLSVLHCVEMKEIVGLHNCQTEVEDVKETLDPFSKLQILFFNNLPELRSVYPDVLPFPCLERLVIVGCPKLKKLPLNSNSSNGRKLVLLGEEEWWNGIEWEDGTAKDVFSPCFQALKF